jgi:hypothetical protein
MIIPLTYSEIRTFEIPFKWSPYAVLGSDQTLHFEGTNPSSSNAKKNVSTSLYNSKSTDFHCEFPSLAKSKSSIKCEDDKTDDFKKKGKKNNSGSSHENIPSKENDNHVIVSRSEVFKRRNINLGSNECEE